MKLNLLIISSVYEGSLDLFYKKYPDCHEFSYNEHYDLLLSGSTEFVASYTKNFNKLGFNTTAIISNDHILQDKWKKEYMSGKNRSKDLLSQQIQEYQPDIVSVEDMRFVSVGTLNSIKQKFKSVKLLIAFHCAPWNSEVMEKLRCFDFIITCTPGLKARFEASGLKSYLVYHGFDTDFLAMTGIKKEFTGSKVVFSGSLKQGTGYHRTRIDLIDYLIRNGIDISLHIDVERKVIIAGKKLIRFIYEILTRLKIKDPERFFHILSHGKTPVRDYPQSIMKAIKKPVFGLDMYNLFQNSDIVLNNHGDVAGDFAGNMRLFETTGVGSCLLTDNKKNIGELFLVNKEIVVYDNEEECADKIKWLMENRDERLRIAKAGQERTLRSHTVASRCDLIAGIIRKELEKIKE